MILHFDRCPEEDADPELDGCAGCPGYGAECWSIWRDGLGREYADKDRDLALRGIRVAQHLTDDNSGVR